MAARRETVQVVRQERQDKLKPKATAPASHDLKRCVVLPRQNYEAGRGWVQVEGWDVFAPVGADVTPDDRLRVRGVLHEIDGVALFPVRRGLGVKISTTVVR